ncbi:MAG TPA: sulfatase-like hydrolase/transferase, partial [Solirubrobacterales bacterium]
MRNPKTQSWHGGATARVAAAIILLALLFGLVIATTEEARAARAKASELQKPSFVVIQTDDQTLEELYDGVRTLSGGEEFAMPNTLQMLGEQGVTFTRYYTPYSLCAPSRVSLLTGRYAHNNHV